MSHETYDISTLMRNPDLVAVVAPAERLFGLLRRSVLVPRGWVALAIAKSGDRTPAAGGSSIEADDLREVLFARAGRLPLEFEFLQIASRDGYLCDAKLALSIELPVEAADLAAMRAAVMGSADRLGRARAREYLRDEVARGVVEWGRTHPAGDLVDARDPDGFARTLRKSTEAACFSAGLRLTDQIAFGFASPELDAVRAETQQGAIQRDRLAVEQQLREAGETARREHMAQVEGMLAELREMAQASPEVSLGDLIRRFGDDQRGQLYRTLLRSAPVPRPCKTVAVAAGDEIVWVSPETPNAPLARQRIDALGGPIRSISRVVDRSGKPHLAVGGACNVALLDPSDGRVVAAFEWNAGDRTVQGGVNAAATRADVLLATHSELGLFSWSLDSPDQGRALLTDLTDAAVTVRNVQVAPQGRVWLSVDEAVLCLEGDDLAAATPRTYIGSRARIAALTVADAEVYAGTEAGQILRWNVDRPEICETVYAGRSGQCRSVHLSAAMGIRRLGLTDDWDAVKEMILDDTVVDRYLAGGDTLRQAWWSDDWLAAINANRSRLYLWAVARPDAPAGMIDIGWICSNHIQDVCML